MKNWRVWIGILVSVLCLYLAVRGIDFGGLGQALRRVQWVWLLPACALVVLGLAARAFRWRLLFYPQTGLRLGRLFNLLGIGYLVNNLLPVRLGDVLRAYLCAELERLSVVRALSTVVVERIADTLAILFLLLCSVPFVSLPASLVRPTLGIGMLASLAVLVLLFLASRKERSVALLGGLTARVGFLNRAGFKQAAVSAVEGLSALSSWRTALGVWMWSLLAWLGNALQLYVIMWATGLRLPPVAALVLLCLTSLGMTVPSSPGYIGVFEYLTVLSLALFGVSQEASLGFALVAHAVGYVVLIGLGFLAAWIEGYSFVRLREMLGQMGPAKR
jgi:hypothetical protein